MGNGKEVGKHGVEAVGDVGKGGAVSVCIEEGGKAERQYLVRSVAAEHLFGQHPFRRGDGLAQPLHGEGRVEIQGRKIVPAVRFQRLGAGRIRVFVGVELDVLPVARLFARRVRRDRARLFA